MPTKSKPIIIDTKDISKIVVGVTFELDVTDNLEEVMSVVDSILKHIAGKAEVDQSDVSMKLEADINGSS